MNLKYFNLSEFDSPDVKGSGSNMDYEFLKLLDVVREKFGKPMKINSGYRTEEHNDKIGGVKNSSHTKIPCKAVDVAISSSADRWKFIKICNEVGITRIGIGNTFIHIDTDNEKTGKLIWDYYKGANKKIKK
jgi:uncharacterized protein YcbK (DUF882 family)